MRLLVVTCGWLLVACGASDDAGLFGPSQTGSGGVQTAGGNSGVGGTSGAAGTAAGGGGLPSGGTGNVASGGASASGGNGATGGDATGGDPGTGGKGTGGDNGTGGNPAAGAVSCGGSNNCKRPENFCCVFLSTSLPTPTCQANAAPCFPGTEVFCDGPEDCINGTVCCGQLLNTTQFGQAYNDIKCRPANECQYSQDRRVICGDEKCPGGLTCKPSSLLANINYCSPN